MAHRGGGALAPENTLVAFRRAIEWWGADVLELDVRATRDGEAVVFHDATLDRTTDGSGPVAAHTLAELAALDAGYAFADEAGATPFRGQGVRIPALAEVLAAFPGVRVNIEVKDAGAGESVAAAIGGAGAEHRVLVAAGERICRRGLEGGTWPVSASEEELRSLYVFHRLHLSRLYRPRIDALQMPELHDARQIVNPRLIREAHAKNIPVHVWTVDEEADMRRLLDWGVDGIITDRPDRLARVLHERSGRPLPPGPGGAGASG
jgi:glycerophosphoryl diester phosphodiesterase